MGVRIKVYFDGGCRPNPGAMEIAVVAAGQTWIVRDLGHGSSADAEWLALIHALRIARKLELADFILLGDAAAVIGPATGTVPCRAPALHHFRAFTDLAGTQGLPRIRHVKRTQNLAGIALAALHPR